VLDAVVDVLVIGEVVEEVACGAEEVVPLEAFDPPEEQLAPMITTRPMTHALAGRPRFMFSLFLSSALDPPTSGGFCHPRHIRSRWTSTTDRIADQWQRNRSA
jgi:hypothetical protein